ncbi:DEAD/DEAH box helicase [Gloeothece verrucosa]|uniref:DEAD-like helicase n=1 Tax=Gloeothece verrucosa (strain PCC 7822) TaxID=497965 RepID=E0U8C9_GLOV7|nr:DEAD/DEAH box helicase family protein [Gloeothece verrucosa]ADN12565.1 DEAD-like helicase [Gloeothece verrucosa PCC 7822]
MGHPFIPRDWQERFVRQYQTNPKKNTLLEGCTAAGKTGGSLFTFVSLKSTLDWSIVVVVTPSEHLRKQYAQDAYNLFGLNLYYSGTDNRLKGLPSPDDLLKEGYHGIVISYQWLTKGQNAQDLAKALEKNLAGKVFVILDEVHHASHELSFGQACEIAFRDHIVSHRLMTSGTPFRSDNNMILGNWLNYEQIADNTYECKPDFRYTLADALRDEIIPSFSFVTLEGEFKYSRGKATYDGQTFGNATTEQQLRDALNTAIMVDGGWVKEAILWAHRNMKRDRVKELPECATYVRVPNIAAARQMKERIKSLTGEEALVVVSKEEYDSNLSAFFKSKEDSSQLIEAFASETGQGARSWIIGVNMLGEGVSIKRLKYRIHATNICAPLSFMQDLGRLLRLFPSQEECEAVQTLIPAHPLLIQLAIDVLNEVAHIVCKPDVTDNSDDEDDDTGDFEGESDGDGEPSTPSESNFIPLASTGEMGAQIVDGEEITTEYANIAEWAIENKDIGKNWSKTPAHFARMLMNEKGLFDWLHSEYQQDVNSRISSEATTNEEIPEGFPSEYSTWLPDKKVDYARKQVNKKVYQLACLLYPRASDEERKEHLKQIHTIAKRRNRIPLKKFIGYQSWEIIYLWLIDRIAHARDLKGTEDL